MRAAVGAALVMSICVAAAIAFALVVLYWSMADTAVEAAAARSAQIAAQIANEEPSRLEPSLLATDPQIALIQVLDSNGVVVAASNGAPDNALEPAVVPPGTVLDLGPSEMPGAGGEPDLWLNARGAVATGQPVTILVGADRELVEATIARVAKLLLAGAPVIVAIAVVGTYVLVDRALRPVEAVRRQVASITGSDLTRRVPVPATRDEVARLTRTMNAMLRRLESAQRTQRRFVGDASHELRSPLTTIITALELAEAHPELLDSRMIEDSLLPEARRMSQLVEDLLLLARADEAAMSLRRVDVDIDDILLAEAARLRSADHGVRSTISACRVTGDPAALARVVRNLTDNATRYSRNVIELRCGYEPGFVRIVVADDGPGIPAADRERVFDRFVRLDETRARRSGGTGLGLAIVAEIVRAHHGSVVVAERPGGGTMVTVELPSIAAPAEQ